MEILILLALLLVSFGVSTFSKSKDLRSCAAVICAGAAVVFVAVGGLAVFFAEWWGGSSGSRSGAALWFLVLSGIIVGIMLVIRVIRWGIGLGKQPPPPQGEEEKSRSSEPPLYPGD